MQKVSTREKQTNKKATPKTEWDSQVVMDQYRDLSEYLGIEWNICTHSIGLQGSFLPFLQPRPSVVATLFCTLSLCQLVQGFGVPWSLVTVALSLTSHWYALQIYPHQPALYVQWELDLVAVSLSTLFTAVPWWCQSIIVWWMPHIEHTLEVHFYS